MAQFLFFFVAFVLAGESCWAQKIEIDDSAAPNLRQFLTESGNTIREYWRSITNFLRVNGFTPTTTIKLVAKKDLGAPAMAQGRGNTIWFDVDYCQRNQGDFGMSIHEAVHLVQAFGNCPWWITEGIADYIRYFRFRIKGDENRKPRKPSDGPKGWERGYGDTGYFLDWINRNKNSRAVQTINQRCHDNKWDDNVWQQVAKASAEQLWKEMQRSSLASKESTLENMKEYYVRTKSCIMETVDNVLRD